MGLEQGARTSFGEQSRRPVIKPPPRRLPWFEGGLVGVLGFVSAHGMLPDRVFAQSLPQSTENTRLVTAENPAINPLTYELSSRVTQEVVKPLVDLGVDIDLTGELLTNAFLDDEGNRNIVYRNIWFMVGMDGRLKVVNVLDKLSKQGLDDKLDFGLFGDPIPPRQDIPIEVGDEIKQFMQSLKNIFNIGPITGYKNYGPFEVYRTPNVALMRILEGPQANTFQLTNTGYQALVAELFPKEYALSPLPFATGGGTTPTPEQTAQLPIEVTPHSFELHYESPNGMFIIDNTAGPKGFRPTSDQTLVEIENYMKQYGLKKLILTSNNTLIEGTREVSFFSICGPTDLNCRTPYLYRKLTVDKDKGEVRWEYRWADTNISLTPKRLDDLQVLTQAKFADIFIWYKYGPPFDNSNPQTNSDEAKNLRLTLMNATPKIEVVIP